MADEYTGKVAAVVIPKPQTESKFLIAKREDNGDWEFPGGKQHTNENLQETAEREIREELGLEIEARKISEEDSYRSGDYEIVPIFAKIVKEDFRLELTDHTDYRWIKPEEAENLDMDLGKEKRCLEAFNLI